MIIEIKQEEIENYCAEGSALVVIGAKWCPDCVRIEPFLSTLAEEFEGKVKVLKVSIDRIQNTREDLNIRKIPTLIFFKEGKEVGKRLVEPQKIDPIREQLQAL